MNLRLVSTCLLLAPAISGCTTPKSTAPTEAQLAVVAKVQEMLDAM